MHSVENLEPLEILFTQFEVLESYFIYSQKAVLPSPLPSVSSPPPLPPTTPLHPTPSPPHPNYSSYRMLLIAILLVYLQCTTKNGLFVFQGLVGMSSIVLRIMHILYPRSQPLHCKRHGEKLTISPRDWVLLWGNSPSVVLTIKIFPGKKSLSCIPGRHGTRWPFCHQTPRLILDWTFWIVMA